MPGPVTWYLINSRKSMTEYWSQGDGLLFVITHERREQDQHWIHYQRVDRPDLNYHCLAPAFYHRFVRTAS